MNDISDIEKPLSQDGQNGSERIYSIVNELFEFVIENKDHIDRNIADESTRAARASLSAICSDCREAGTAEDETPEIEINKSPPPAPHTGNEQRKMHLLRMVSVKLSHAFDKKHNPNPIERKFSVGIDYYLRRLFTAEVFDQLNDQAQRILMVSGVGDNVIINSINANPHHKNFLNNVLVRFAQSFRKFSTARFQFMEDLNESNPSAPSLGKNEFHLIMSSLLNDLMLTARSQRDGAMMDFLYGPKTSQTLDDVSKALADNRRG